MRANLSTFLAVLLGCVSLPVTLPAAECAGVTLPERDEALVLNGMALREWMWTVDVYVAGLYLESRSSDYVDILNSNRSRKAVAVLARDVGSGKICGDWRSSFEENLELTLVRELNREVSTEKARRMLGLFDVFCHALESRAEANGGQLQKGSAFAITFDPARGTGLTLDGAPVAYEWRGKMPDGADAYWIPGKDFTDALLASWIGAKPSPGRKFRQELLEGTCMN